MSKSAINAAMLELDPIDVEFSDEAIRAMAAFLVDAALAEETKRNELANDQKAKPQGHSSAV
jgi:hypothetical protein